MEDMTDLIRSVRFALLSDAAALLTNNNDLHQLLEMFVDKLRQGLDFDRWELEHQLQHTQEELARLASFPLLNPAAIIELGLDGQVYYWKHLNAKYMTLCSWTCRCRKWMGWRRRAGFAVDCRRSGNHK